jgi:hypothetical protein
LRPDGIAPKSTGNHHCYNLLIPTRIPTTHRRRAETGKPDKTQKGQYDWKRVSPPLPRRSDGLFDATDVASAAESWRGAVSKQLELGEAKTSAAKRIVNLTLTRQNRREFRPRRPQAWTLHRSSGTTIPPSALRKSGTELSANRAGGGE